MLETAIHVFYFAVGAAAAAFLDLLAISSVREGRRRAAFVATGLFLALAFVWLGVWLLDPGPAVLVAVALPPAVFALFFFLPVDRPRSLRVSESPERVDERDVIFAREEYHAGTEKHAAYYADHPERRETDERIRRLPELLAPGGRHHEPARARHVARVFRVIEELTTRVDGPVAERRDDIDPPELTARLERMALDLGADDAGAAALSPRWVYSHVGRGPEEWGRPIDLDHRFAVAFVLEMAYERVEEAPRLGITEETAARYLQGAQISIAMAEYVRSLGWPARAHIAGSNYRIMLPPVAHDAGLGELGRLGYLIHPRLGARIRLGAITTAAPLVPDGPIAFGVREFCAACWKCAASCPSGAIPKGGPEEVRGVEKWPLDIERCITWWRVLGTDCGLCMKSCPMSHPPALVHDLVRAAIRRSPFARKVAILCDDLFYGKRGP